MKRLLALTLVTAIAPCAFSASTAIIEKGKAPVVVLPKYIPSASEKPAATPAVATADETVSIEKFVVTGSVLPKPALALKMHFHR